MSAITDNQQAGTPTGKRPLRIGDLLLEKGLITSEQVDSALEQQREMGHQKLLGEILVELKFVTQEQVMAVLAEAYGIPFARVNARLADPEVLELLPREFIDKNHVLPLFKVRDRLTVAVHEPTNVFLIEEIQRLAGCPVQIVASTMKESFSREILRRSVTGRIVFPTMMQLA